MSVRTKKFACVGALVMIAGTGLAAVPTAAHAATAKKPPKASSVFWVNASATTVSGQGSSCTNPGYSTVQSAVDAADASGQKAPVVRVCSGTYVEQVSIAGSESLSIVSAGPGVSLTLPDSPASDAAACGGLPDGSYAEVALCGPTGGAKVSISGIDINAVRPDGTCGGNAYSEGVFVGSDDSLSLTDSSVEGGGASALTTACGQAFGVHVGYQPAGVAGHAVLTNDRISQYGKNGVVADDPDTTLAISGTTVQGVGEGSLNRLFGVDITGGALGTITKSNISGNETDAAGLPAAGVQLHNAAPGSGVTNTTIAGNDVGIAGIAYGANPKRPAFTVSGDTFTDNRDEAIDLRGSYTALSKDTISGIGQVGVELEQVAGDLPIKVTAKGLKISDQTTAAIRIVSDNDPSDVRGSLSLTSSKISGNPQGATVNGSILNESNDFDLTLKGDS